MDPLLQLVLATSAGLSQVMQKLQQARGRKVWIIDTYPGDLPARITGLWVAYESRDYVFVRAGLQGCLRRQTIMHELCHILCQHTTPVEVVQELLELYPNLADVGEIRHACYRENLSTGDEYEAEVMASTFLARATSHDDVVRDVDLDPLELAERQRLESVFRT